MWGTNCFIVLRNIITQSNIRMIKFEIEKIIKKKDHLEIGLIDHVMIRWEIEIRWWWWSIWVLWAAATPYGMSRSHYHFEIILCRLRIQRPFQPLEKRDTTLYTKIDTFFWSCHLWCLLLLLLLIFKPIIIYYVRNMITSKWICTLII